LIDGQRPSRDRRSFPFNGWLTLKSGHSETANDGQPSAHNSHSG
jgi:hypothetical protein